MLDGGRKIRDTVLFGVSQLSHVMVYAGCCVHSCVVLLDDVLDDVVPGGVCAPTLFAERAKNNGGLTDPFSDHVHVGPSCVFGFCIA